MHYLGEVAALGTAITWAMSAIFFTSASKRIGSFTMSHYRMAFGFCLILIAQIAINHFILPPNLTTYNFLLLAFSGFTGFFLCDTMLFQSYIDCSPRIGALIFNTYPIMSAVLAWSLMGEKLSLNSWLGIFITMAGVVWVALENSEARMSVSKKHYIRGILLGFGAAAIEAISLVAAKPAMTGSLAVDSLTATLIRAVVGGAAYWVVSFARGRIGIVMKRGSDRRAILLIAIGAVVGPFIGVWLSMAAVKHAPLGIAATIMALMPVAILPMTAIVYKEKISWRAIIGAIVACLGVAILVNG